MGQGRSSVVNPMKVRGKLVRACNAVNEKILPGKRQRQAEMSIRHNVSDSHWSIPKRPCRLRRRVFCTWGHDHPLLPWGPHTCLSQIINFPGLTSSIGGPRSFYCHRERRVFRNSCCCSCIRTDLHGIGGGRTIFCDLKMNNILKFEIHQSNQNKFLAQLVLNFVIKMTKKTWNVNHPKKKKEGKKRLSRNTMMFPSLVEIWD